MVVLFSIAHLVGHNFRTRLAYFLTLFAVWDIFYYVWLKVLLDWPGSVMDWDVLFLIPTTWAGPVLAPVLISLTMLFMAVGILYRESRGRPLTAGKGHILIFIVISIVLVGLFCWTGRYITHTDYDKYFSWTLFIAGEIVTIVLFLKCYAQGAPS